MAAKKAAFGALLTVVVAYGVYPYVTLYRLGQAIRQGDQESLQTMVDWPAVREGIKEDICDFVVDNPPEAKHGNKLPPFGAGFMRGIAMNAVDTSVTPEGLVSAVKEPKPSTAPKGAEVRVDWAFFDGPSGFVVDLSAPGQPTPIRLKMDFRDGGWQVTRVWLPRDLLAGGKTRT